MQGRVSARCWQVVEVARTDGKRWADLSTHLLQAAFLPLVQDVKCSKCQLALRDRIACAMIEWASVKVSRVLNLRDMELADHACQRTI